MQAAVPIQPEQPANQASIQAARQAADHAGEPREFLQLVDQLELSAGGRTLNGSGRGKCLRAFTECPRGFEIVADRAIREAHTNPIGLLLWLLEHHEHRKAERAAAWEASDDEGIEF